MQNTYLSLVADALKCSSDRIWTVYTNSLIREMSIRACSCWDDFRKGKCKDKLIAFVGAADNELDGNSYKYYMRTDKKGRTIGDTASFFGHPNDFVYIHDATCAKRNVPRM